MSLKFIALSGTMGVNENLYIYEYQPEGGGSADMIIVDCGVGFPDSEMMGVDLVIPDFTYIKNNADKLRGILLSHGHEDHIGALPFLLKDVKVPIYCTKLVKGFVEEKLKDVGIEGAQINVIDPEKDDPLKLGVFGVNAFRVNHSVPDSVGYAIDTPEGRVFHVAEHKFDPNPVDGFRVDEAKAKRLASGEVLMLASDCLGSNKPGSTPSEAGIEGRLEPIMKNAPGLIYFTTISSSLGRMRQAVKIAQRLGKKVVFMGRSVESKSGIAHELGYFDYPEGLVVSVNEAKRIPRQNLMYIIAGSYGQVGSALYRISIGEHRFLSLKQGDTVIFSSDPAPPGAKETVDFVVDQLIDGGADVHYYDLNEGLHVSGHGQQEDIKKMWDIVKPKYYIPVGGTIRFMDSYGKMLVERGVDRKNIFELKTGEIVEFKDKKAKISGKIDVKQVLVDGLKIGDVGKVVLSDRDTLSKDGIAMVVIQLSREKSMLITDPEIVSKGFVFEKSNKGFLRGAAKGLRKSLEAKGRVNKNTLKRDAELYLEKFFFNETGRRPMILPVVVEV